MTCRETALHPLGILMSDELVQNLEIGWNIRLHFPNLTIQNKRHDFIGYVEPPMRPKEINNELLRSNAKRIYSCIMAFGRFSEVGRAFLNGENNLFHQPVQDICESIGKAKPVLTDYMEYFGGGAGLTPAWDDFCAGLLFADRFLNIGKISPGDDFFRRIRGKTTEPSFWQLKFTEAGKLSLAFENLLADISIDKISSLKIATCIGSGYSSGTDILCGILALLSSINGAFFRV